MKAVKEAKPTTMPTTESNVDTPSEDNDDFSDLL